MTHCGYVGENVVRGDIANLNRIDPLLGEALIIDVREPQEFAAGHVPGAVNIPRGLVEFQIWKQVGFPAEPDTNRPVYLQCQNGNRASLAAQSLAELGFTNTTAVVMRFEEWQQAGHPLVK
jgi:rhodanese-related sulfurtransferase